MSNINQLYHDLSEAYTAKNLNHITVQLIALYKEKQFGAIRKIAQQVSEFTPVFHQKDSKCFAGLMKLYHPDRGAQYRADLERHFHQKNYDALEKYAHILLVNDLEPYRFSASLDEIDYQPEYVWEDGTDGFSVDDFDEDAESAPAHTEDFERSFYNLIKLREYGHVEVEFPYYYLEDIEQFELSYNGLESLDGVEHCLQVKILDVSNNELYNIDQLEELDSLEELYLSNNHIEYLDALSGLQHLRVLDVSGNELEDITPILHLPKLEYVNLIGNFISDSQLNALRKPGRVVMA